LLNFVVEKRIQIRNALMRLVQFGVKHVKGDLVSHVITPQLFILSPQ
jgi:hypothetical protein